MMLQYSLSKIYILFKLCFQSMFQVLEDSIFICGVCVHLFKLLIILLGMILNLLCMGSFFLCMRKKPLGLDS